MAAEYALYKGDTCLAIGTIKQIAKELGICPKTVKYYHTPCWIKRTSENARRLVRLDEED